MSNLLKILDFIGQLISANQTTVQGFPLDTVPIKPKRGCSVCQLYRRYLGKYYPGHSKGRHFNYQPINLDQSGRSYIPYKPTPGDLYNSLDLHDNSYRTKKSYNDTYNTVYGTLPRTKKRSSDTYRASDGAVHQSNYYDPYQSTHDPPPYNADVYSTKKSYSSEPSSPYKSRDTQKSVHFYEPSKYEEVYPTSAYGPTDIYDSYDLNYWSDSAYDYGLSSAYDYGLSSSYPTTGLSNNYASAGLSSSYPTTGLSSSYPTGGLTGAYPPAYTEQPYFEVQDIF